jgi:ribosomal protein L34E
MSWSNEELIEELMWEAHEKGLGSELIDLASAIQSSEKLDRTESFQRAYDKLKIGEIKIAKFQKKPNGSKVMVCHECDEPLKEYWKMTEEEKMAADRQTTIPAQYCENCKTNI